MRVIQAVAACLAALSAVAVLTFGERSYRSLNDMGNYAFSLSDRGLADTSTAIDDELGRVLPGDAMQRYAAWIGLIDKALDAQDTEAAADYLAAGPLLLGGPWLADYRQAVTAHPPDPNARSARDRLAQEVARAWLPQDRRVRLDVLSSSQAAHMRLIADAGEGFLWGASDSMAGLAGAVAADFLVWGDVRDFSRESYHAVMGEPVDEVMYVLSGIGLGLTAATYATSGATAPVKGAASVLKAAKRAGSLSKPYLKFLRRQATAIVSLPALKTGFKRISVQMSWRQLRSGGLWSEFRAMWRESVSPAPLKILERDMARIGRISDATSPAAAMRLLRHVDGPTDLARLELAAKAGGKRFLAAERLIGKRALGLARGMLKLSRRIIAELIGLVSALLMFIIGFSGLLRPIRHRPAYRAAASS